MGYSMKTGTQFGENLRKWRRDSNLTLRELAADIGLSLVHVSEIERGKKNPPDEPTLLRWLWKLGKDHKAAEMHQLAAVARTSVRIDLSSCDDETRRLVIDMADMIADGASARDLREWATLSEIIGTS